MLYRWSGQRRNMTLKDLDLKLSMLWLWMNVANFTSASGITETKPQPSYLPGTHQNDKFGLEIHWINSTTSSIAIKWTYERANRSEELVGSQVECFVPGGKFSSHLLSKYKRSYVLRNLDADTEYTVCTTIFIADQVIQSMQETKDFTSCVNIWTIPYIRRDSVIILLLTTFYFAFMALLGYSQWRRKVRTIKSKYRRDVIDDDEDSGLQNQPLRWQELEEKERRRNRITSIEDHDYR